MKLYLLSLAVLSFHYASIVSASAVNDRVKRQLGGYRFPGPRSSPDSYYTTSNSAPQATRREPQYEESADQYSRTNAAPAAYTNSQPAAYRPVESQAYPARNYGRQTAQSYGTAPSQASKEESSNSNSNPNYSEEEEKKDKEPTKLELLLAQSKFTCSQKKDGYYADNSVACQVFHYCVSGAKHSWMCPEGTVFHQVHLNCVPSSQDICSQSEKFYVVNDYLHKALETRGPNNTILYAQRYYPEEFLGDSLHLPKAGRQTVQSFGYAPREERAQQARPQSYSASNEDDGSYNSAPQPQYQNERSYAQPAPAPKPAAYAPQPRPAARAPVSQSYGYPTNYPASSAPRKPQGTLGYSPSQNYNSAPASYQSPSAAASSAHSYPPSTYSASLQASAAPYTAKPATTASPYSPSVNYASQPTYKKVQAASVAPVAPKQTVTSYGTYPTSYSSYPSSASSYGAAPSTQKVSYGQAGSSPYGSQSRAKSSLFNDYPSNLRSGVTYEEDY